MSKIKFKKIIAEAFENVGGVFTHKPLGQGEGYRTSPKKVNEGPSYEYANYMKRIEKAENIQAKEVNALVKLLQKKGLKKEATLLGAKYMKGMRDFNDTLKKLYHKLV